jgi:serine protease Do
MVGWARREKVIAGLFVALTLVVGILIGTVVSGRTSAMRSVAFVGKGAAPLPMPDAIPSSNTFASIVNRVEPAVVNISTTQVLEKRQSTRKRRVPQAPNDQQPDNPNDPMQDFFDRFFDGRQDAPPASERSLGSGVIVDRKGYILTNNHVVDQATKIQVQLNGETTKYTAKVVGVDEETDLAVIKIDSGRELPVAKLGNSDGVQVGDWVLAIGSPFGLNATVTAGIVSAKDRGNVGKQFQKFLQTDAAINPGNSGGPLVDLAGEVIGINTAIITGSRGYEGSKVKIGYVRDRQSKETSAVVEDRTRVFPNSALRQVDSQSDTAPAEFGLRIENLTPDRASRVGMDGQKGVLVVDVDPASFGDDLGFTRGDVIAEVNRQPVSSVADYKAAVAKLKAGQNVVFKVLRRQDADRILTVFLPGVVPAENAH